MDLLQIHFFYECFITVAGTRALKAITSIKSAGPNIMPGPGCF